MLWKIIILRYRPGTISTKVKADVPNTNGQILRLWPPFSISRICSMLESGKEGIFWESKHLQYYQGNLLICWLRIFRALPRPRPGDIRREWLSNRLFIAESVISNFFVSGRAFGVTDQQSVMSFHKSSGISKSSWSWNVGGTGWWRFCALLMSARSGTLNVYN